MTMSVFHIFLVTSCFCFLATVTSAAVDTRSHVCSVRISFLWRSPSVGLRSCERLPHFPGESPCDFCKAHDNFHSHQHILSFISLTMAILTAVRRCVLMIVDIEHFFKNFLAIFVPFFFKEMPTCMNCPFFNQVGSDHWVLVYSCYWPIVAYSLQILPPGLWAVLYSVSFVMQSGCNHISLCVLFLYMLFGSYQKYLCHPNILKHFPRFFFLVVS